jgi:hypothetical protein
MSVFLITPSMTNNCAIAFDELEPPKDPAFKGSFFTTEDYRDAWGDDWHTLFMQMLHNNES